MPPDKDDDGDWNPNMRRSKRIKLSLSKKPETTTSERFSNTPPPGSIFTTIFEETPLPEADDFEAFFPKELCIAARQSYLKENAERDRYGNQIRTLTLAEICELENWLANCIATGKQDWTSGKAILHRRLELRKIRRENAVFSYDMLSQPPPRTRDLELCSTAPYSEPNKETLDALYKIQKTPYESSFAYRLLGSIQSAGNILHRDWQTRAVWMDVMDDIKLHYALSHPEDDFIPERSSSIDYVTLEPWHLPQIHDLLTRVFWAGIDVSSSLTYSPEQCTVIALYKRLVVGAAFLSSPVETYLTYLVVRSGWESSGIASTILYLLLNAHPTKDITLHVSANNPAMLLYNKFGFKAEEFVAASVNVGGILYVLTWSRDIATASADSNGPTENTPQDAGRTADTYSRINSLIFAKVNVSVDDITLSTISPTNWVRYIQDMP